MKKEHIVLLLSLLAPLYSVLGQVRQQPHTQHTITLSGTPIDIEWSNDRKRILILVQPINASRNDPNHLYTIDAKTGVIHRIDTAYIYQMLATRANFGTFVRLGNEIHKLNDSTEFTSVKYTDGFKDTLIYSGAGVWGYKSTGISPYLIQTHNDNYLCVAEFITHFSVSGRDRFEKNERFLRLLDLRTGLPTDTKYTSAWASLPVVRDAELSRSRNASIVSGQDPQSSSSRPHFLIQIKVSEGGHLTVGEYRPDSKRPFFWFDDIDSVVIGTKVISRPWDAKPMYIRDNATQTRPIILPSYRHRLDIAPSAVGNRLAVMALVSDSVFVSFQSPHPPHSYTLSPEDDKLAVISRPLSTDSVWTVTTFDLDIDFSSMQQNPILHPRYSADSVYVGDEVRVTDLSDYGTRLPIQVERTWFSGRMENQIESGEFLYATGPKEIITTYSFADTTINHSFHVHGRFWGNSKFSHRVAYRRHPTAIPASFFLVDTSSMSFTINNHGREILTYNYHVHEDSVSTTKVSYTDPLFVTPSTAYSIAQQYTNDSTCIVIVRDSVEQAVFCGYGGIQYFCPSLNQQRDERSRFLIQTTQSQDRLLASWHRLSYCKGSNTDNHGDGTSGWSASVSAWTLYIHGDVSGEGILRAVRAPDGHVTDAAIHPQGDLILPSANIIQRYDPIRDTIIWKITAPRLLSGIAYGNKYILTHKHLIDWATGEIADTNMFGPIAAVTQSPKHGVAVVITQESDSNVVLYDVDERTLVRRIATYRGNADLVSVSRDGDAYAVLDSNGMLSVFDLDIKDLLTSTDDGDAAADASTLRVRPNPATFDVTITVASDESTTVDILSSEGRLVTTFPVTGSTTLPIDSLPVGYYRVVARMRNGLKSVPLVIVR